MTGRKRVTILGATGSVGRSTVEIKEKLIRPACRTYIRDNVALAEAPAQRRDIFAYSPKSPGAQDYLDLCKEILGRLG